MPDLKNKKRQITAFSFDPEVYLFGIQIPFINITVSSGIGAPSTASITIEPDPVIPLLSEYIPVDIFIRDPSTGVMVRLFKGSYFKWNSSKTATGATMTITAVGDLQLMAQGSPVVSMIQGFGPLPISGGTLPTISPQVSQITFISYFLGKLKKTNNLPVSIIQFINNFSSYNGISLLSIFKSEVNQSLTGITDNLINKYVQKEILDSFIKNAASFSPDSSLLDILRSLLGLFKYTITEIPAYHSEKVPLETAYLSGDFISLSSRSASTTKKSKLKDNKFLLLPDMRYAIPPPCNWIFPSQIMSYDTGVDFSSRPTRKFVRLGGQLNGLMVMSPSISTLNSVSTNKIDEKGVNVLSMFAGNVDGAQAYSIKIGDKDYDLRTPAQPIEVLKGIIPSFGLDGYSALMATVKATIDKFNPKKTEKKDKIISNTVISTKEVPKIKGHVEFIQELVDYTLSMESRRADAAVSISGNIYVVPGFPCLILDDTVPIYGMVDSVNHTFSSSGAHNVSVSLSNTVSVIDVVRSDDNLKVAPFFGSKDDSTGTKPSWATPQLTDALVAMDTYNNLIGSRRFNRIVSIPSMTDALVPSDGPSGVLPVNMTSLIKVLYLNNDLDLRQSVDDVNFRELSLKPMSINPSDYELHPTKKFKFSGQKLIPDNLFSNYYSKDLTVEINKTLKILKEYRINHKGGRSVSYIDKQPFGTRTDTKG